MTESKNIGASFFGNWLVHIELILILVGAYFANFTFDLLKRASSFDNWPAVQATVIGCIEERQNAFALVFRRICNIYRCRLDTSHFCYQTKKS